MLLCDQEHDTNTWEVGFDENNLATSLVAGDNIALRADVDDDEGANSIFYNVHNRCIQLMRRL